MEPRSCQAVEPSCRQAVKPSSRQAIKPSSRQALKQLSRQAGKLSSHQAIGAVKPSSHWSCQAVKPPEPSEPSSLGWEFQFFVPISGTPIVSGIPILCLIPKIPVRNFLWKFQCLESQKIGIPICNIRNSGNFFAQELSTFYCC